MTDKTDFVQNMYLEQTTWRYISTRNSLISSIQVVMQVAISTTHNTDKGSKN